MQGINHADVTPQQVVRNAQVIPFIGRPIVWYDINVTTGQSTLHASFLPAHDVSAVSYNGADGYMYGYDQTTKALVRVDCGGMLTQLGRPAGLPAEPDNMGAFDTNGFFYLFFNNSDRFYTVDLRPGSASFLHLVDPAEGYSPEPSNRGTKLTAVLNISDWAYNPADGNLYGVQRNGRLMRIVPATGQVTALSANVPKPGVSFGAVSIDANGAIYAIANNDGMIYRYTLDGSTASGVPFAGLHNSTACPAPEILLDYGDAPDLDFDNGPGNYNTLLSRNGPRHILGKALTLGSLVTGELDAYQNSAAAGDDVGKGIQDDGLAVPLAPLSVSADGYSLRVAVSNQTGTTAYLYGWVDFNQNGIFELEEAAPVASVPSTAGMQMVDLTFAKPAGTALTVGNTFVRLRLTTEVLENAPDGQDARSVGLAADGEVEDYILRVSLVADIAVIKYADRDSVSADELVTYTIEVTNNGPDAAMDVRLADQVPAVLDQVQYSLDGGDTWYPWVGTLGLDTLDPGVMRTILLRGRYTGDPVDLIENTVSVATSSVDPTPDNNTDTVVVVVKPPAKQEADLSIEKTANTGHAIRCRQLIFTLSVTNHGPAVAQGVVVTDRLPSQLCQPFFSIDGGTSWRPWTGSITLGDLAPDKTAKVLVGGTVGPCACGPVENTATVYSMTPDPDSSNNQAAVAVDIWNCTCCCGK